MLVTYLVVYLIYENQSIPAVILVCPEHAQDCTKVWKPIKFQEKPYSSLKYMPNLFQCIKN